MRKIDKRICIATQYEDWIAKKEKAFQETGRKIPNYNNNDEYYSKDVFVALLYCQNGLCAYTEKRLIYPTELEKAIQQFDSQGKYQGERPKCDADVEHFDSKKKAKNGWAWDNFLVVYDSVNKAKGEKVIDEILKPDNEAYNPFLLLEYDKKHHLFFANETENDSEACQKIENMIIVLGLNHTSIKHERKEYLQELWLKQKTDTTLLPDRFFTAYGMAIQSINEQK